MSDEDSDDNLQMLLEATDKELINDSMFNGVQNKAQEKSTNLPSLRHKNQEEDHPNWFIKVTPEFRNHIGKKLSQLLDEEIIYKTPSDRTIKKKKHKDNIRLFRNSTNRIRVAEDTQHNPRKRVIKRPITPDYEDLKQVTVSGEDILSKKDTRFWSNRSKAAIFNYYKDKTGQLTYIEPPFK